MSGLDSERCVIPLEGLAFPLPRHVCTARWAGRPDEDCNNKTVCEAERLGVADSKACQ